MSVETMMLVDIHTTSERNGGLKLHAAPSPPVASAPHHCQNSVNILPTERLHQSLFFNMPYKTQSSQVKPTLCHAFSHLHYEPKV